MNDFGPCKLIKIYQAYYKDEHQDKLDPDFHPYDNRSNLESEYREYPFFLKFSQQAIEENLDLWGYFSWTYRSKMPGLTGQIVLDQIKNNPGYDVYFWNPYANHAATCYNVWEQGQHWHPYIIGITEEVFRQIGIDPNWLYQPMPENVIYFALYCVGNKKFWDGFLAWATIYKNGIPMLPERIKKLHNQSAQYPGHPDLWYFPFIHERLLSTYLAVNYKNLRIWSYHHNKEQYGYLWDRLTFLKDMAIKYSEPEILKEWFHIRRQINCSLTLSEQWINKFDKNLLSVYHTQTKIKDLHEIDKKDK